MAPKSHGRLEANNPARFYVALTRAQHSVGFVGTKDLANRSGLPVFVFRKAVEAISAWGEIRHRLITGEITQEEYDAWKRKF